MGEWSKTVGEFGEQTVENFLDIIGWKEIPKTTPFSCIKPKEHSEKENRQAHGLDFFFPYKSPLWDGVLKSVCISVKYTSKPYPNSPNSKFKEHFEDLAYAIECFRLTRRREYIKDCKGYDIIEDIGVLFWLSNSNDTYDDVISQVSSVQVNGDYKFDAIYLVDNKRVDFIYRAVKFVQNQFKDYEIDFFYPNTGKNLIPTTKENCGKILPVEYINSSILPIRAENKVSKNVELVIFTIDPFSLSDLKRLIGLAQELSTTLVSRIHIAFPNYRRLENENDVRVAKTTFSNKKLIDNIEIICYNDDFRNW